MSTLSWLNNEFIINSGKIFSIIYRLLGPAAQSLPLSASQVLASSLRDTRVLVMDSTLGIFTNQDEEQVDFVVSLFFF